VLELGYNQLGLKRGGHLMRTPALAGSHKNVCESLSVTVVAQGKLGVLSQRRPMNAEASPSPAHSIRNPQHPFADRSLVTEIQRPQQIEQSRLSLPILLQQRPEQRWLAGKVKVHRRAADRGRGGDVLHRYVLYSPRQELASGVREDTPPSALALTDTQRGGGRHRLRRLRKHCTSCLANAGSGRFGVAYQIKTAGATRPRRLARGNRNKAVPSAAPIGREG
jgi:hypothetical protein